MNGTTSTDIRRLEDRRYKAMVEGDAVVLAELLDDDLTYVHSSASVDTKQSYIAGVRDKVWEYQAIERPEERIVVRGDGALVFARLVIDIRVRGVAKHLDNNVMAVWNRSNGAWRLLAVHSTAIPK